jgi:hypothetical protein
MINDRLMLCVFLQFINYRALRMYSNYKKVHGSRALYREYHFYMYSNYGTFSPSRVPFSPIRVPGGGARLGKLVHYTVYPVCQVARGSSPYSRE